MSKPKAIRAHIGAHKTATTHFQDTLAHLAPTLKNENIIYLEREHYRPIIRKLARGKRLKQHRLQFFKNRTLIKDLMKDCDNDSVLLLSEENILGDCIHLCDIQPFAFIDFTFLNTLLKVAPTELFLSIRSFDSVLSGAYCTALKYHPREALIAKEKLQNAFNEDIYPSWIPLIERLKNSLPNASLSVWTQEHYKNASSDVIRHFIERPKQHVPVIERPRETVTPSEAAIVNIEQLIVDEKNVVESGSKWESKCDDIYRKYSAETDEQKFSFFTPVQKKVVQQRYRQELDEIDIRWPGIIVR
ncbi:hypothetical protein HHX48_12880 [Salinimonas sp. HHU 13199]|uniref:Uncharacterized protein n=1 Tax=Salinimonas profundi TaxID=2729140 RepID=A0ABR8LMW4_9ALTE|nr:hypothetical protein [Salinimonas profundi]MBD3586635.1 hypothetical protein [Salinimonas profundi]